MNKIQVYMHGENSRDFKLIDIDENGPVKDIILIYQKEFPQDGSLEEIDIFLEDGEKHLHRDAGLQDHGIRKKCHIHGHRCKSIAVTVFYNGEDKVFDFSPATTAKKVLRKAVAAFQISEKDAADYLLKTEDKTVLQATDHIGSYVSFPHCSLKLFLTPTQPVQG